MKADAAQTTTNLVSLGVITEVASRTMIAVLGEELSSMAAGTILTANTLPDIIVREISEQISNVHGDLA